MDALWRNLIGGVISAVTNPAEVEVDKRVFLLFGVDKDVAVAVQLHCFSFKHLCVGRLSLKLLMFVVVEFSVVSSDLSFQYRPVVLAEDAILQLSLFPSSPCYPVLDLQGSCGDGRLLVPTQVSGFTGILALY